MNGVQASVARGLLEWNGVLPRIQVVLTSAEDAPTRTYSLIADYGFSERILCSGCHRADAETLLAALEEAMRR